MDWGTIIQLDKQLLLTLNGSNSMVWDQFMYWSTKTWCWIPLFILLLYLVVKNNSFQKTVLILVAVALAFALAEGLSSGICKPYFARLRPTHDPEIMALVHTVNGYRGGLYSFFSSHASNTFSIFLLLSLMVRSWRLGITLLTWAILHTYTRIYLGVHFPGDILVGLCWGLVVGSLVYIGYLYLASKIFSTHDYVSERCTSTGYAYTNINLVCLAFMLNVFFVLILSLLV